MANTPAYEKLRNRIAELEQKAAEELRLEKALLESEKKYRELVQNANSIIIRLDTLGKLTFFNEFAQRFLGFTEGEILGKNSVGTIVPETDSAGQNLAEMIRHLTHYPEQYVTNENENMRKNGERVWIAWTNKAIRDVNGKITEILCIGNDITERKRIEEALRESEKKFRNIVEASPMGMHMYRLHSDGRLIFSGANPAADAILGIDNQQFIGKTIEEAFPSIIGTEVPDRYRQVCELGEPWQTEQIDYEDEQIKGAFEVHAFQTAPGKMATLFLDITQRKRMEDALRKSEERFREMAENIREAFWLFDWIEQRLIYVSPAYETIWGRSVKDLYDRNEEWNDSIYPDDLAQARESFAKIVETGGGEPREYRIVLPDGTIRWVSDPGFAIADDTGRVCRIAGIAEDITEKKLLTAQLLQAERMEGLGTLAGGIAHDFNNLLMGIQGRTSLMKSDTASGDPNLEHLNEIENYVKSAAELTKQLLGLARGGKYEVTPTDLNEIIEKSAHLFARTKKEIRIHKKFQDNLWTVEVDQGQLDQVLLNVYVNAWQAMPAGGNLYIQTENTALEKGFTQPYGHRPGNYVKVTITDTGIGMDDETIKRVFDPFFTTKEKERGTGLGLASAYGIVNNHDGIITASTKRGKGSTFTIYLPASSKQVAPEKSTGTDIMTGTETILLVDDEEMIIGVGVQLLEKMGYDVLIAHNGHEALQVYEAHQDNVALIILDVIMPDMGGGEVYRRLSKINPQVKVLLSSGYSLNGQANEILKLGCDGFIQKPFTLKALSEKMREIISKG
jgi:PAS domain S-box-containing protein